MKLKELVANSLPRVRGKKKKAPALVSCPISASGTRTHPASSSAPPMSPNGLFVPSQHLPLSSPASAVMATANFNSGGDDATLNQIGFARGLEHGDGAGGGFSTFLPAGHQPRIVREDSRSSELTWHGNALYRGIQHRDRDWETATEKVFSTEVVSSKYSRGRSGIRPHGMTTSHSAEGISAHHLLMMSKTGCDARMAMSEYGGSCSSQMSVISESAVQAYSSALHQRQNQQQHTKLDAHYHQHSHQHYHHYHHHHHVLPSRAMPLAQQPPPGQQLHPSAMVARAPGANGVPTYAVPHAAPLHNPMAGTQQPHNKHSKDRASVKQEMGFFRKSFASFRGMRKQNSSHNNNTVLSSPQVTPGCVAPLTKANLAASEHMRCSVCPYPDQGGVTADAAGDRKLQDTRPVKPKRKGLKGFSKNKKNSTGKENKAETIHPEPGDNSSWFSDNDAQSMIVAVGQPITEPGIPGFYPTWDRPRRRECSVDSCSSSRIYAASSREGSCIREVDASGFDSASLSGYESDFPRGTKVNRSRSRIRTNPWLPSPQPSLGVSGGCRRGEGGAIRIDDTDELRESQEDMVVREFPPEISFVKPTSCRSISRSASFEHHRPATMLSMSSSYHAGYQHPLSTNDEVTKAESKRRMDQNVSKGGPKTIPRPLTPNVDPDSLMTMSLDRPPKPSPPAVAKKPSWWNLARRSSKKEQNNKNSSTYSAIPSTSSQVQSSTDIVSSIVSPSHYPAGQVSSRKASSTAKPINSTNHNDQDNSDKLNDLNMDTGSSVLKSRPSSIVSPNSEFVLLAGHLEQLAHNISFEYEDLLNSNLENSGVLHSAEQMHMTKTRSQILSVNEKNRVGSTDTISFDSSTNFLNVSQEIKKDVMENSGTVHLQTPESPFSSTSGCSTSESAAFTVSCSSTVSSSHLISNAAHSPDSGVGGLGSTDGDDALSSSNADQTPGSPQYDGSTTPGPDLDDMSEGSHGSGHTNGFSSSCSGARPKTLANTTLRASPDIKQVSFPGSIGFGQDDDSSATVSESDVDNTHYQDGSSMSDGAFKNIYKRSSPLPQSKTEGYGNYQTASGISQKHFNNQPQTVASHRPGKIMGARATMLEHFTHADERKDLAVRQSDADPLTNASLLGRCQASRPSALKTTKTCSTMSSNNIYENHSSISPLESGCSRNITVFDSIESTSDHDPPITGRMVRTCHLDASMVLEANLRGVLAPPPAQDLNERPEGGRQAYYTSCSNDNEDKISQSTEDMASACEETSLMDFNTSFSGCNSSKWGDTKSLNASFDMNDACVQTEFDEDFSCWDEMDALEMLEENALDPAESTRRWLLTGNMQGSADTGYGSQSRESQVFMDEDTMQIADDLAVETASQRLSRGERSSGQSSDEKTPRNSVCLDSDPTEHKVPSSYALCALIEEGPILYRPNNASKFNCQGDVSESKSHAKKSKPSVAPKPSRKSTRSISPGTVDQMFSNIEQHFQDIFRKRCAHNGVSKKPSDPKRFSDSSDSTLASEASGDSSFSGGAPVGELHDVAARWREAKAEVQHDTSAKCNSYGDDDTHQQTNPRYVNGPVFTECVRDQTAALSNQSYSRKKPGPAVAKKPDVNRKQCSVRPAEVTSNSKREKPILKYSKSSKENVDYHAISSPDSEKADYLEFLRDVPLSRSNLKRPLFLVPGVGPVDISCSETLSMFSDSSCKSTESQRSGCYSSNTHEAFVDSPTSTHSGKKLKFKSKLSKSLGNTKAGMQVNSKDSSPGFKEHPVLIDHASSPSTEKNKAFEAGADKRLLEGNKNRPTRNPQKERPSSRKAQQPGYVRSTSGSTDASSDELPASFYAVSKMDEDTRALAERVIALKREKDDVYRKLQAAQLEELSKTGNLKELRKHAQYGHKEALLETLRELRNKLEQQKRMLQEKSVSDQQSQSSRMSYNNAK